MCVFIVIHLPHCRTWNLLSFRTNWSPMDAKNISVGNRFALTSMAKLSANVIVAVVVASIFSVYLCLHWIDFRPQNIFAMPVTDEAMGHDCGNNGDFGRALIKSAEIRSISIPAEDVCDLGSYVIEMNILRSKRHMVYSHGRGVLLRPFSVYVDLWMQVCPSVSFFIYQLFYITYWKCWLYEIITNPLAE